MTLFLSIQQPEFFPWAGFFDKLALVDKVIWLDNVQFKKRYFENRNKILTANGPAWIRVPVHSKGKYLQKISDVAIDGSENWKNKIRQSLVMSYGKAPFFNDYVPPLIACIDDFDGDSLTDFNIGIIDILSGFLGLDYKSERASLTDYDRSGSDLILDICQHEQADIYLSGISGRDYLEPQAFADAGIRVRYQEFSPLPYTQFNATTFAPYMSMIDCLCNIGHEASRDLLGRNIYQDTE